MICQVSSKKPLKVEMKNAEDAENKYKTPMYLEDPYLPGLFVIQGTSGPGETYSCMQMCRHFEQKGTFNAHSCYVQRQEITQTITKKPYIAL